jgi:hypothetical protein
MITSRCSEGITVSLDVKDPNEVGMIEVFNEAEAEEDVLNLLGAFSEGWHGMFGHVHYLSTTAVDLNLASLTFAPFRSLNPVLVEGHEILSSFTYDPTLIH